MADRYFRRGHWVRKRGSKKKQASGWVIVAVIVGAAWLWGSLPDQQHNTPQRPSPAPESVPSAPAVIAEQEGGEGPPPEPTEAP